MTQAPSIVDSFLRASTVAGERTVAWVRLGLCSLVVVERFALMQAGPRLAAGEPGEWMATLGLSAGILLSLATLLAVRRSPPRWLPELSALVDPLLITVIMLPQVLWASPDWAGLFSRPAWPFLLLAAVAAGFRLSRLAVTLAGVTAGLSLSAQLYLDHTLNADQVALNVPGIVLAGILWIGSVGMGFGMTSRTRKLVEEGAREALKAERARQRLGVYVSQEIADAAMGSDLLKPGGERREVAVLFSDLRGFTAYSSGMSPERLIDELNAYLTDMVAVIREEGGVVDKYIGDAIMVVFGIPKSRPDDALRAIRCARGMQEALDQHNERRRERGLRPLRHGVGVHYGEVVAGNVGTEDRLQYTVVGDVVNTASRLEGATKALDHAVLISQDALLAAGRAAEELGLTAVGRVPLRGRPDPVGVYSLTVDPAPWPIAAG